MKFISKAAFLPIFLASFLCVIFPSFAANAPEIQLANIYHEDVDLSQYLVSEKLDGVRGYWDGKKLISRQGNEIKAPKWFVENFPNEVFEGELWIERGKFEEVSAIVRQQNSENENAENSDWQRVSLMIFDLPKSAEIFEKRAAEIKKLVAKSGSKYLRAIEQSEISDHKTLMKKLDEVVAGGGEGFMLHRKNSYYVAVRNDDILKVKKFEDAEAKVIGYIAGNGKFKGQIGALLVENLVDKIHFKIGGGLNDEQRTHPPKIGEIVTYKFFGKTKNNVPRFASFMRVRDEI